MSEETQVTPQETSVQTNSEATPAQETTTSTATDVKTETTQSTQEPGKLPENWEYNGDRKAVPKEFQNYVKGIDRYWSKKSQTLAELGQKAKEYEEFRSSEDYKAYQQFITNQKTNTGRTEPQQPLVTQEEIDAIALGDAKTLESVIERKAKQMLEANVKPQLEAFKKEQETLVMQRKEVEAAEVIKSFADLNPDFNELLESPVGEFMIDAARRGMGIEDIYKSAKQAESFFAQKIENQRKAELEKKKAGSVVGKSIPGTSNVVYAEDEASAKRLAIELTLKGDNRQVQVKKK